MFNIALSRRNFLSLAFSSTVFPMSVWRTSLADDFRSFSPLLTTMLESNTLTLLDYLQDSDMDYDAETKRFYSAKRSIGSFSGDIKIAVLGRETEEHGRLRSPRELREGADVEGIICSLFFSDHSCSLSENDVINLFKNILIINNIDDNDILSEELPDLPHVGGGATARLCARYKIGSRDTIFFISVYNPLGFTLGCAFLDYYADAWNVAADYEAIVASGLPWDLPINDRF